MHTATARPTAKPGDAAGSGCPPDISSFEVPFRTPLVAISVATHYQLYHDWQSALAFCRTLPDLAPPDIGQIRSGQRVTFTVDAYAGEQFAGTVRQVRLQPTVVSNVTTYSAIIDGPNPDLKLKPGMTANLKVEVEKRSQAVRIPNAALRFRPTTATLAAFHQAAPATDTGTASEARVWTYANGTLMPLVVRTGISDGMNTELVAGEVQPGTDVVTAVTVNSATTAVAARAPGNNPLLGTQPAGGRGPGRP